MSKFLFPILILAIIAAAEYYMWQAIQTIFSGDKYRWFRWSYLILNIALYGVFFSARTLFAHVSNSHLLMYLQALFVIFMLSKLIVFIFFIINDLIQLPKYVSQKIASQTSTETAISRSSFLSKLALGVAAIPAGSLIYGMIFNPYNYQFRRVKIKFPNLPDAFNGFTIVQLSDIHSGSFTQTEPIIKAVEKINKLNADVILFTGDLVNNVAEEMQDFMQVFDKLKSKNGVLSITGNHDYGDYVPWDNEAEKQANFQRFMQVHKNLGWDLLMNEHRIFEKNGEKIAIIGIENWGHALRFPRYGKLAQAYKGTEEIPFKVLMSHDPSHWDAQVRPEFPDIDLMLSGHTHGFQFGIESKYLKWSPSQWVYKQWAGLYQIGKQYLYVNRGFGFLGYPGRVGILPEVTIIELQKT
ncbi:MAG TPA: metallophosphoesterase [Chitinophagales bacterium]